MTRTCFAMGTAALLLCAACGDDDKDGGSNATPTPDPTPAMSAEPTPDATRAPTSDPTPAATQAPTPTPSAAASPTPTPTPSPSGIVIGDWRFTRIIDRRSQNPSGLGPITALDRLPVIEGDAVYFRVSSLEPVVPPQSTPTDAILRWEAGEMSVIAKAGDPIPGGLGELETFDVTVVNELSVQNGRVAFIANGAGDQRAIYFKTGEFLDLVVNRQTPIPESPDGDNFMGIGEPIVDGDRVAFSGNDFDDEGGAYLWQGGQLSIMLDRRSEFPSADGTFITGGAVALLDDTVIIGGCGDLDMGMPPQCQRRGLYFRTLPDGPFTVMVENLQTPLPDVDGDNFWVMTGPLMDAEQIIFHGRGTPGPHDGPFGSIQHKGIYRYDRGTGDITMIANTEQTMPGGTLRFSKDFANGLTSQYVCHEAGNVLFRGVGTVEDRKEDIALFFYDGSTQQTTRVVSIGDNLGGKAVLDILTGRHCLSGGRIVFWAEFEDGDQAYLLGERISR